MDRDINETRACALAHMITQDRLERALIDGLKAFKQVYPTYETRYVEAAIGSLARLLHATIQNDLIKDGFLCKGDKGFAERFVHDVVDAALNKK